MSARQSGPYHNIARKWLALAERRMAHLIELYNNGRWTRYFTERELAEQLQEMTIVCDRFARIAGMASPAADSSRAPPPSGYAQAG
jgi:uncharacterized repeat protein (TIGR03809 family)